MNDGNEITSKANALLCGVQAFVDEDENVRPGVVTQHHDARVIDLYLVPTAEADGEVVEECDHLENGGEPGSGYVHNSQMSALPNILEEDSEKEGDEDKDPVAVN